MKKVFFILAVAATVVSCGTGSTTDTTTTDSTSVKCDSMKCDTTKVSADTTK